MSTTTSPPQPGHNSGSLDLALALDADQLLKDLQTDSTELFTRKEELLNAFDRFQSATAAGIPSDEVLARAGDFKRQLDAHIKVIDARRTNVKAPVLAAQRTIDGFYKRDLSDPLDAVLRAVLGKMDRYVADQRRAAEAKRREEADRAREEAARIAAEAERQQSPALMDRALDAEAAAETVAAKPATAPHVRSDYGTLVTSRKGPWKVRVVDINLVPRQFLVANEPVLLATAKTDARIEAGQQPIAGVEFYREIKTSVR